MLISIPVHWSICEDCLYLSDNLPHSYTPRGFLSDYSVPTGDTAMEGFIHWL